MRWSTRRGVNGFVGVGLAFLLAPGVGWSEFGSAKGKNTRGPGVLKEGVGVRALGLGNAFVGVADDVSSLVWNPAGMNQLTRSEVLFQHEAGFEGQTTDFVGVVRPVWWRGGRRSWGMSMAVRSDKTFDLVEEGSALGGASPSEGQVGFSFATPWGPLSAGMTGKWVYQETFQQTSQALALDMGLLGLSADGRGRWGAGVFHLGTPLRPGGTELPLVLRLGGAYDLVKESSRGLWRVAGEVDVPSDDRLSYHGGVEYAVRVRGDSRVSAQLGYRTDGGPAAMDRLTGGLGWENKSLRIDYAFAPSDALGVRQRLDVGWKFGSVFPQEERQTLLWAQAQEAVEDGRWLKARALLEDLRALSPSFYPAKRLLRVVEGRMAQSLDPETLFLLGHTALEAGEYGKSADYLRKLLLLKPGHAEAQADLRRAESADAERRAARIEKEIAQETAQEILRLERRAGKLRASGSWEEALAASGRLRELDPARARDGLDQSLGQVQAMAEVADRAGDWETAQRLYRAVGLHRDVRARLEDVDRRLAEQRAARSRDLYSEGLKAYKGGDGPRARALFQEALTLTPEDKALKRALERLVETSPALNGK